MVESSALLKRRSSKGYRGFESLPHRFTRESAARAKAILHTQIDGSAPYATTTRRAAGGFIRSIVSLSNDFTRNLHPSPPTRKSITQGSGFVW